MELLSSARRVLSNIIYPYRPFSEEKPFKNYIPEIDNRHFTVYQPKNERIIAANGLVICTQKDSQKDTVYLYPDYHITRKKHKIVLNGQTFPGLITGSHILLVLLLPYIPKTDNRSTKWRLVIVTDKCQVYHNFPDNCPKSQRGLLSFAESCIWDLPGNKYPSLNKKCNAYEYYYPFLPERAYEYHPAGDSPRAYHITYENGEEETLCRFYFPKRSRFNNPFYYLNGYEPDPLMSFIGTYCGNASEESASRIVVFASHDGGANWFAKYEFNDDGRAENYGNSIRLSNASRDSLSQDLSIYLCKRSFVPSDDENAIKMVCGERIKVHIRQNDTLEVVLSPGHGLQSGNVVALKCTDESSENNTLFNNTFADGNFGNGVFYKVKLIDENTVQLFECVSKSRSVLPARHIHSINRVKDGFLVATGETYPQGWLMLFSMTDTDSWSQNFAWDKKPIIRLNSSRDSVQRIVGAILLARPSHEIIIASDCSSMNLDTIEIIDGVPTNQMGIYKGKLSDIDDFRKFELLEEVHEPSFFFKDLDGNYVFCGQRGELAIGIKRGRSWRKATLESAMIHYMGRTLNFFVIDGKLLRIK